MDDDSSSIQKKTFLLYYDQAQIWDGLPDELAGKLIKLLHKNLDEIPQNENPIVEYAYGIIKKKIDDDYNRWLLRCQKNKENVEKRWEKINREKYDRIESNRHECNCIESNTDEYDYIRPDTKYTDNDNDNVNDNVF